MSEVKVVSIEGVLPPTVVSKNRAVNVAYLFPRGNLVVQELLDAPGVAIEESIANSETQMIADMVTLRVNVDSAAQVEWYAKSGATERFFHPLSW
jgi:hypothetical protein